MSSKNLLRVKVFTDHDFVHCLHVTAGLFELEQQRVISTRWVMPRKMSKNFGAVRLEVTHPEGQKVKHCFDLTDRHYFYNMDTLEWADFYWKSNYNTISITTLPLDYQGKIRPYGLYFPARSRYDRAVLRRFLATMRQQMTEFPLSTLILPKTWRRIVNLAKLKWRSYHDRLFIDEYAIATQERSHAIYFHPGCWDTTRVAANAINKDERVEANLKRQTIIRSLREKFGSKFIGGFVKNKTSQQLFPNDIYPDDVNHRDYVRYLQTSHIVISTNGLDGCHSWRTGEAFAAGAIVLTETPFNVVDNQIEHGANVFFYNAADECVALCEDILGKADTELVNLHKASHQYYLQNVSLGQKLEAFLRRRP